MVASQGQDPGASFEKRVGVCEHGQAGKPGEEATALGLGQQGHAARGRTDRPTARGKPAGGCGVTVVLDASALLAYLPQEPGAEVVQKALSAGVDVEGMRDDLQALGMQVEPFLAVDGERARQLWLHTRQQGLSLGDRAWVQLPLELELQIVR